MKVIIEGSCLGGGYSKLAVSRGDELALRVHDDSQAPINVPLNIHNIAVKNHLVSVGKSPKIKVIEHLFSALYGLNFFNVEIDFWGDEVPFFDGSSGPFVKSLLKIKGRDSANLFRPKKKVIVRKRNSFLQYEPIQQNNLIIDMELSHPYITTQKIVININKKKYINEIAPARTFVFTNEDDSRLQNLPSYGIGVTKNRFYCATPLRFTNELVRHKILDLLGDLYVLQKKIEGKIIARNTSHRLNFAFVKKLMNLA